MVVVGAGGIRYENRTGAVRSVPTFDDAATGASVRPHDASASGDYTLLGW